MTHDSLVAVRLIGDDQAQVTAAVRQLEAALGDAVQFDQLNRGRRNDWLAYGSLHIETPAPAPDVADSERQPIDLQHLQDLADAATSGPWERYFAAVTGQEYTIHVAHCDARLDQGEADAAYIAAMHPQTTTHLIAALRATLAFLTTVSAHRSGASLVEGDRATLLSLLDIFEHVGLAVPGGTQLRKVLQA